MERYVSYSGWLERCKRITNYTEHRDKLYYTSACNRGKSTGRISVLFRINEGDSYACRMRMEIWPHPFIFDRWTTKTIDILESMLTLWQFSSSRAGRTIWATRQKKKEKKKNKRASVRTQCTILPSLSFSLLFNYKKENPLAFRTRMPSQPHEPFACNSNDRRWSTPATKSTNLSVVTWRGRQAQTPFPAKRSRAGWRQYTD